MKTAKWLVITVAAGVFAAGGGLFAFKVHAAERPGLQRAFRGQFLERAREKLGLTDDQVTKIKAELKGEKEALTDLLSRLHEARIGLREAIQGADSNETSVRAASAKVAAVEADLAVERLKLYGRISPILTADQREKVMEFQAKLDDFVDNAINRIGDRL
jgi:Spy/CpxP family protein refolding chaperone